MATLTIVTVGGCDKKKGELGRLDRIIGRHGITDGRFQKPRAMTIDRQDRLYVVDMTARIQVFDSEGTFLRVWQTPEHVSGRPTGISIGIDGNVLVADTHYYRVLIYSPAGKLLRTMGGQKGQLPGQFGLVTSCVQDLQGNYYVAEYGEYDRIQKLAPDGRFLCQWGRHGSAPGEFCRPQKVALDRSGRLWVCDACNHRLQVFDAQGKLLKIWGSPGAAPGQLYYPYDLNIAPDGSIWVAEFGNHRIQKFTPDGRSLGTWGTPGGGEGQLNSPWALARDSRNRIFVLDTGNHRVQRIRL